MTDKSRIAKLSSLVQERWFVFIVLLSLVAMAFAIRVRYAMDSTTLDDAYITFRYVRNLAQGFGFVYNPGEHVLGTTTPFFTLMLVPFTVFGVDLVTISKSINILASTMNVLVAFFIARRQFDAWAGLLGALLIAISTSNIWAASTGMETEFNVLILLIAAYAYVSGWYDAAAILSALAVMTRPDALIFVAILWGWYLVQVFGRKQTRHQFFRMIILFILCLLPWLIFTILYFGSPLPNSIVGKASSYRVPISENWAMFVEQFGLNFTSPRALLSTILFLFGCFYLLRERHVYIIFPLYFLTYSTLFILVGARLGSGWYWQPLWFAYSIVFGAGFKYLVDVFQRIKIRFSLGATMTTALSSAFVLLLIIVFGASVKTRLFDTKPARDIVSQSLEMAGQWLYLNTPADTSVGLESIGAVGWFSERYILDEGGLVSPAVARINARIGRPDHFTIIRAFQPDYYLAWASGEIESVLSTPEQSDWFAHNYQPVASFGDPGIPAFVLFKKVIESR